MESSGDKSMASGVGRTARYPGHLRKWYTGLGAQILITK